MPIQRCQKNGKPGYRFGQSGTCYTYTAGNRRARRAARSRARRQERAIRASGYRG